MNNEADFDEYRCKVPRIDRDGNDISGHRLEPGGRRRDSGTLSALAYDFEPVEKANQTKEDSGQPGPSTVSSPEIAGYFLTAAGTILMLKVAPHIRSFWDNKAFPRIKKQLERKGKAHPADATDVSMAEIAQIPMDTADTCGVVTAPRMIDRVDVSAAGSHPTKVASA